MRRTVLRHGLLVLLGAVLAFRSLWALPPQWTDPIELLSPRAPGRLGDYVLLAEGQRVAVFWVERRFGEGEIFWRESRDGGATWSAERLVPGTDAGPGDLAAAFDRERLLLVWVRRRTSAGAGELVFQTLREGVWTPPLRLETGGPAVRPRIAATAGPEPLIGIVYERLEEGRPSAWYLESQDGGANWDSPSRLGIPSAGSAEPTIVGTRKGSGSPGATCERGSAGSFSPLGAFSVSRSSGCFRSLGTRADPFWLALERACGLLGSNSTRFHWPTSS